MIRKSLVLFFIFSLAGCVTPAPDFTVKRQCWDDKSKIIGIVIGDIPTPSAHKSGYQELINLSVLNSGNNELEQHLKTLNVSNISDITKKITKYLEAKGLTVKYITNNQDLKNLKRFEATSHKGANDNYSELDYRSLKSTLGIDKLIVINIIRTGTMRKYYGFVPLDEPSGFSHMGGYVVNLDTNQLEWKHTVIQQTPNYSDDLNASSKFSGLTKAVYVAFDRSKNMLFNHFAQ